MSAAEHALAILELAIGYRGKLDLDEVQHQLGLSDEEMTAAVDLLREAWVEVGIRRMLSNRPARQHRPPRERFSDRKPSKEIMDFIVYA